MDMVALGLRQRLAAAADVIGRFQPLHQPHKAAFQLLGAHDKFCREVQAGKLRLRLAAEIRAAVEFMEHLRQQIEMIFTSMTDC